MPEKTILRKHAEAYLKTLDYWLNTNLGEYECHRLAALAADREHHLTADEQRQMKEWLDKTFENRHKKPKGGGGPTLWDGLPGAS